MSDRETTNAKNATDAVIAIRQLAREEISRGGVADRVLVEAVAGSAIKVRALGSDVPGAQLIPISGFVPAVGSEVLLFRTFGGQLIAVPLTSVAIGTGAGQLPTAGDVVLASQVGSAVSRPINVFGVGVGEVTTSLKTLDIKDGIKVTEPSTDLVRLDADYGGSGGTFGTATTVARSDHSHPASGGVTAVADSDFIDLTLSGSTLTADIKRLFRPYPRPVAGTYIGPLNGDVVRGPITSQSYSTGTLIAWPIWHPSDSGTLGGFLIARASGSTAVSGRIGLYAVAADGLPTGGPLREATISLGSAAGVYSGSVTNLSLPRGWYWIAFTPSATVVLAGVASGAATAGIIGVSSGDVSATGVTLKTGISMPHTYGALPSFNPNSGTITNIASVWAQIA